VLRSLLLALVISCAADAAEPTLNVRYVDAMASLQPPFTMRRAVSGAETIYQGEVGTALLTIHVRGDLVSKAELQLVDATVPDKDTGANYLRDFTIRGHFLTNVLPSWRAAALRWTDETIHTLSPDAIAGRPQSRTTARDGAELRLDLSSAGTQNGHPAMRVILTAQPEFRRTPLTTPGPRF